MKLELVIRPKEFGITGMTFRRCLIVINDVVVDNLKEGGLPQERRGMFDKKVADRIALYELALNVKHKKVRGT